MEHDNFTLRYVNCKLLSTPRYKGTWVALISPNPFGHVWAIWFLAIDQQNRRKYEVSKEWVQLKPEIPAKNGIQMVIHGVILP